MGLIGVSTGRDKESFRVAVAWRPAGAGRQSNGRNVSISKFAKGILAGAVMFGGFASVAMAQDITVGLITKTEGNPFFVKMREGAAGEGRGTRSRPAHLRRQVRRRQ